MEHEDPVLEYALEDDFDGDDALTTGEDDDDDDFVADNEVIAATDYYDEQAVSDWVWDDFTDKEEGDATFDALFRKYRIGRLFLSLFREADWDEDLTRWAWWHPETHDGIQGDEGDPDGHLEFLDDAGEVDEGTDDDLLEEPYVGNKKAYRQMGLFQLEGPPWEVHLLPIMCVNYWEPGEESEGEEPGLGTGPEPEDEGGDEEEELFESYALEDELEHEDVDLPDEDDEENGDENDMHEDLPLFLPNPYRPSELKLHLIHYLKTLNLRRVFKVFKQYTSWK